MIRLDLALAVLVSCAPAWAIDAPKGLRVVPQAVQSAPAPTPDVRQVVVVPVRWTGQALPITQDSLRAVFDDVSAWVARESYGRIALQATVLPVVDGGPANPKATLGELWMIVMRALPGGLPAGAGLVMVFPSGAPIQAPVAITKGSYTWLAALHARPVVYAHEIMHHTQWGALLHAARAGSEYGSLVDVMGNVWVGTTATMGLSAPHKAALGVLTPRDVTLPFAGALQDIDSTPDALRYRDYWIECRAGRVYVHRTGTYFGGSADQNEIAALDPGAEWRNPNAWETPRSIRHDGACAVSIT